MNFKVAPTVFQSTPTLPRPPLQPVQSFSRAHEVAAVDGVGGRTGEIELARRDAASNIEALHRIYNGIDRLSPARGMNNGKPVALKIPHDLNSAFRKFLTDPAQPSDHFRRDDPRARPNANGTLTAGKAVTYSLHELPQTGDGKRHVVVTIGGFSSGEKENSSTPGRIWNNRTRAGNQGRKSASSSWVQTANTAASVAHWATSSRRRNKAIRRWCCPSTAIRWAPKRLRRLSRP